MTDRTARREGFGLLGVGAAACAACCAAPVLAFLGGLSVAGLASTVLIGGAGLVVALVAAIAYVMARRRRRQSRGTEVGPAPVEFYSTQRRSSEPASRTVRAQVTEASDVVSGVDVKADVVT